MAEFLGVTTVLAMYSALSLPAYWVFRKAGWSGWWFLMLVIPLVNLVVLWVFAFRRWPVGRPEVAPEVDKLGAGGQPHVRFRAC